MNIGDTRELWVIRKGPVDGPDEFFVQGTVKGELYAWWADDILEAVFFPERLLAELAVESYRKTTGHSEQLELMKLTLTFVDGAIAPNAARKKGAR
jgi:hypothetical protein